MRFQNESRIAWESFSLVFTVCYLFLSFLFPFHGLSGIRDPDHGEERKGKTVGNMRKRERELVRLSAHAHVFQSLAMVDPKTNVPQGSFGMSSF